MSNNSSPCLTCALRVTVPLADPVASAHAHEVFLKLKILHPKSFRVFDMTVPKEEQATWFCVIGDRHFNKDNVTCPKWIPALGVTISDAISLNLNRTMLRITWIMLFLATIGLFNLVEPAYKLIKHIYPDSISTTQADPQHKDNPRGEKQYEQPTNNDLPMDKRGSPVRVRVLKSVPTVTK